jgi:putative membrane protein insertion efficiency factor
MLRAQDSNAAYTVDYLSPTSGIMDPQIHRHDWSGPMMHARNEAVFLFGLMYWFYKNFISSQDVDSCVFVPSCSTYMILAIQKHGVIIGFLEGMDRLTRCSPFANGHYPLNPKARKYEDPVE